MFVTQASANFIGRNIIENNPEAGLFVRQGSLFFGNGFANLDTTGNIIRNNGCAPEAASTRSGMFMFDGSTGEIRNTLITQNCGSNVQLFLGNVVDIRGGTISFALANPTGTAAGTHGIQIGTRGIARIGSGTVIDSNPGDGVNVNNGGTFEIRSDTASTISNNGTANSATNGYPINVQRRRDDPHTASRRRRGSGLHRQQGERSSGRRPQRLHRLLVAGSRRGRAARCDILLTDFGILDTKSRTGSGRSIAMTPAVAPLKRRRLVDDAAETLRKAILDGRFLPGARLRQTDLADQLAISRTPIREALVRLQQEGLVDLLPGGGVRVKLLDLDEAVELYDLREMLDGLAARLAAARADAATFTRLEQALTRQARCVERDDAGPWFPAHVAFHEEIVRAAGNRHLTRLSSIVRLSIRHFHPLLLRTEHRLEQAWREHRAIYEAILTRDAGEAERLARQHIVSAKEIVLKVMTQGSQ